jgi:hypothetical protein
MLSCAVLEWTKILLPSLLPTIVAAAFGYFLLRRLEEIKSEVARHSDFSRKWAELFFDVSDAFMVSIERLLALFSLLSDSKNPNDEQGMKLQQEANALYPALYENYFRIKRLVVLAPTKGKTQKKQHSFLPMPCRHSPGIREVTQMKSASRSTHSIGPLGKHILR